jgi:ribosomal protein L11 methyltransferase
MNYYQISFPIPDQEEQTEILIAILTATGYDSFEEQEEIFIAYIQEDKFVKEDLLSVDYIKICFEEETINIELIPDKNWNEVWESNYPPVVIDNRCYVRAPFHESIAEFEYEITIKPKMAFGTAHHETTYLMISLLLEHNLTDHTVLDMGCGSGILAIMANMKNAKSLTAIDIDKWSYDNTLENTGINGISNMNIIVGGAEMIPTDVKYDTILANINKNILLRDIKYYANALTNSGQIYLSGFYSEDLEDICNEAVKFGISLVEKKEKNNWIAAVFEK